MYEAVSPRALRWTGRLFAIGTAVIIAATIRVAATSGAPLVDDHTWSRTWKLGCDQWAAEIASLLPESKGYGTRPVVYCIPHTDHGERFIRAAGPDRLWGTADDIVLFRSTTWR